MRPRVQHLLETRFSVRPGGARPLDRGWLEERLELLLRYCLPSVAAQTTDAFTWALLCDESTDRAVLDRLRELERELPSLRIVTTAAERGPLAALTPLIDRDAADVLITTRLDSDDAICDRYLEAVQGYAEPFLRSDHRDLLVNFPRGYRLDVRAGRLYEDHMRNSMFHSLFERLGDGRPKTVLDGGASELSARYAAAYDRLPLARGVGIQSHARLHQHYPTQQDDSMPAWLIVVHGGNVANGIHAEARERPLPPRLAGFTLGPRTLDPIGDDGRG